MTRLWPALRIGVAVLCLAALNRQLGLSIGNALGAGSGPAGDVATVVANYFSYFTVLSNIGAVVVLGLAGLRTALRRRRGGRGDDPDPGWLATALVCVSTYMIITGVVYNLVLRSIPIAGSSDVWTNEVLHVVGPLFLLLDALVAPGRRALSWRTVGIAAVPPILWAVYTMLRANLVVSPMTGDPWWYPYPFLDPHLMPGGYLGVAGAIVGVAALIIGVAAGVTWAGRRRGVRITEA